MTPAMCLAIAIYFEARGEPLQGQYAVGQVVLNRVEDERYPDTVCDVVFEDRQFSFTHDGRPDRLPVVPCSEATPHLQCYTRASRKARRVADDLLNWVTYPSTSTHYHTVSVDPFWNSEYDLDERVGNHIFYTNNTAHR